MKTEKKELAVVLGATGALGSTIVKQLAGKNLNVRAVARDLDLANKLFKGLPIEIEKADITSTEQTLKVVEGATTIYHCIGLPYNKWLKLFPKIQKNIILATEQTDSLLVYADNLYMYSPVNGEKIDESCSQKPSSKKGQLRKILADELLEAHNNGKIKVTIVRMGDFYGPNVVNGFTKPLFLNALEQKPSSWIGNLDQQHSLIYIEDAAKGMIEAGTNPSFVGKIWHVEGAEAVSGQEFIEMINHALNQPPKYKVLKRGVITLLSPIVPIVKELKELLPQWEQPFVIDGSKFRKTTGLNGFTNHKEAISTTLKWFQSQSSDKKEIV